MQKRLPAAPTNQKMTFKDSSSLFFWPTCLPSEPCHVIAPQKAWPGYWLGYRTGASVFRDVLLPSHQRGCPTMAAALHRCCPSPSGAPGAPWDGGTRSSHWLSVQPGPHFQKWHQNPNKGVWTGVVVNVSRNSTFIFLNLKKHHSIFLLCLAAASHLDASWYCLRVICLLAKPQPLPSTAK